MNFSATIGYDTIFYRIENLNRVDYIAFEIVEVSVQFATYVD